MAEKNAASERDAQGEESDPEREEHREERTEGEGQDDGGGDDADELVRASRLRIQVANRVAPKVDAE